MRVPSAANPIPRISTPPFNLAEVTTSFAGTEGGNAGLGISGGVLAVCGTLSGCRSADEQATAHPRASAEHRISMCVSRGLMVEPS
jgi:hypothetical protein